jgi:hypothetical protein
LALRQGFTTSGECGHADARAKDAATSYDICHIFTP